MRLKKSFALCIGKGTLENLQYLVEAGISVTSNKTLQAEGWRLSQKFEIPEVRIVHNWAKIFRASYFESFTTYLCSYSHTGPPECMRT